MAFQAPPPYVPNDPQDLAANLRFIGPNGNLVTRQFPWEYQSHIGGTVSQQIDVVNKVINTLNVTNTTINNQQTQINNILTSGFTLPKVNSGCLSSGTNLPVDVVTGLLVANSCSYNAVLGQTSSLYQAIATQGTNLSAAPAFSQSGSMSSLIGWKAQPLTVADTINNQWLSYLDARTGISTALAAVTPTCAQVIINYQAVMNNFYAGLYMYFNGYSFIPTGYTDNGSTIQITDGQGGVLLQSFDIVTQSTASVPLILNTSGSTLSPTASTYEVTVNSNVKNTALNIICQKATLMSVINPTIGTTPIVGCCPDIGTFSIVVTSGSTVILPTYALITGLTYKPRFVGITQTSLVVGTLPFQLLTVSTALGGATLNVAASALGIASFNGTFSLMWMAFK